MSNHLRGFFLFLTVVAVLFVSAIGTTNVYADDGTLPPPETGEVQTSSGEETVVTEPLDVSPSDGGGTSSEGEQVAVEPVAGEPVVEEQVPAEADGSVEVAPVEADGGVEVAPAEAEGSVEAILEQVPENTTVTVLNAEGEAQPLTSQASADAIIVSDPIWCPKGQDPTPGLNGCTTSYSSFTKLLTFLQANESEALYQQAGTIYVQKDVYAGGESSIDFNLYNFQSINNYDLIIRGGWDTGDNSLEQTDTTKFNIPIVIGSSSNPWAGSLTLSNISVSGVDDQTGVTLFSQGSIELSNVQVTNSQSGANLSAGGDITVQGSNFNDNKKFGATIQAGGNVKVENSEFNNNESSKEDGFGLQVNGQGDVTLAEVTASHNEKYGADVSTTGKVTVKNSVFSGNVSYSSCSHQTTSGGYGLKIVTTGPVSLDGVKTNKNYLFGAHLEGSEVEVLNSFFNKNGSGSADDPKGYGLEVLSTGEATLISIEANNNQLFGANVQATDDVVIQHSFFNGNKSYKCSCNGTTYYGYGLQVVTTNGDIDLLEVSANENNLFGARLKAANVSIAGGTFSNNGSGSSSTLTGRGLEIESAGNITLADVTASNNQLFGANIQAVGDVFVSTSIFSGHQVYTCSCHGGKTLSGGGYGLQIVTVGEESEIALSGVQASDNYLYGAHLAASRVLISGDRPGSEFEFSLFNNNKEGLDIESSGTVSLTYVKANDNRLYGATIQAGTKEGADGTVSISKGFFNGNHSYTSSSCKGKTYYGYGLKVVTTSDYVSLTDVEANNNYLFGAHLEGAKTDVWYSSFNNNGTGVLSDHIGKGLEIESASDSISLNYVTASNNQLFGADIQANGSVSVRNSIFNGNVSYTSTCGCKTYDGYGLQVLTTSDIYLYNVTANENYLFGASLEGASVDVSYSAFNLNSSHEDKNATGKGLEVKSTGDVSLQYVEANNNQLFGANLQADGQVNVFSSVFAGNKYYTYSSCKGTKSAGYGLQVVSTGPIVLGSAPDDLDNRGVKAYDNGAEGTILDGGTTVDVSNGAFYNNGANGLSVTADGNVTLTNVSATGNKLDGADVKGGSTVEVSDSSFSRNGADGLSITAEGNVTLTNVSTVGNKLDGVDVGGGCTKVVYVNGGTFTDNGQYGIKVTESTYTPKGTQTFANNHSGNVFQNSSTCFSSGNNNTGSNSGSTGGNNYGSAQGYWWYWFWNQH